MDWQTLFTAFAGALGGTTTALLIAGSISKGMLDQWLKKDFKRFEAKLDALATREETKFSLLHTESANAAKSIFAQTTVMMRAFTLHVSACAIGIEGHIAGWEERKGILQDDFAKELQVLKTQAENNRIFFDETTNLFIGEVVHYAFEYSNCTEIAEEELGDVQMEMIARVSVVELNFKKLLGVAEMIE